MLLLQTWAHWGDLQIDCGREVYVPYELLKGRMLYRDLAYPYGPLVPYLQALTIAVFGLHFTTFYIFGLVCTLTIAYLAYSIARSVLPPAASLAVSIVCLTQGFSQFIFNYIFPYSYAAVAGLLLGLATLYFLLAFLDTGSRRKLAIASLVAGLTLISKQEFGAVAFLAVGFAVLLDFVASPAAARLLRHAGVVMLGLLVPALTYGWLFWRLTPDFILRENFALSATSPFMRTLGPRWIAQHGFRFVPREMISTLLGVVFSLGTWFLVARWSSTTNRAGRIVLLCVAALTAALAELVFFPATNHVLWALIALNLWIMATFPLGMCWLAPAILIGAMTGLIPGSDRKTNRAIALIAVFALALALRVLFAVQRSDYSVYYDLPIYIVFMIALTAVLRAGAGRLRLAARDRLVNNILLTISIWLFVVPIPNPPFPTIPLETPLGLIFTKPAEAAAVPKLVSFIESQTAAGHRVLILPEFPMMYAMTGTEAPSRWFEVAPGLLGDDDEKKLIADAEAARVDYVIVTNRATPEYGVPYFGLDWAQGLYAWIVGNFEQVGEFGSFTRKPDAPFAALVYKRRGVASSATPGPAAGTTK
ncbi:MAG TPA: glycosyltransferase family 39 protein [Candidatus Acidoferrales bacterium]|nr:glycosyltransferase family 39 protein [Candidatus Acidoferrales bacterium]